MQSRTNGLCVAGFVVSLVTCFFFGFYGISGAVGIALSAAGISKAHKEGGATGLGTAGIVIGIINIVLFWVGYAFLSNLVVHF